MAPVRSSLMIELESLEEFDAHFGAHQSFSGTASQGLNLLERTEALLGADVDQSFFLGCELEAEAARSIPERGGCVFPRFPDLPFRAFRPQLYTATELYSSYVPGDHDTYELTCDGRSYRWHIKVVESQDVIATLAERVHDHAIDDALNGLLDTIDRNQIVAIMGGHGMTRDEADYRSVAELARELVRAGFYVATGGGPGAMEAANLGAWFAAFGDSDLDDALAVLAGAATFEPVGEWLDAAFAVRERWPRPDATPASLGVPTWHYGHEPPNVFATEIAKYFSNSIREDGLLAIALGGVVFAPGSAGTIQEVFQDAAQNHYKSFGVASPMVFFGEKYWTETKPVYPLLQSLAADREYGSMLAAFDDIADIVKHLQVVRPSA